MTRFQLVLVLAAFCLTVAYGQPPQGPSKQVKRFAPYARTFEGQLIMTAGGKTVTAKVKSKNSMISSVSWVPTSFGKVVNKGEETLHRAP